MFQNENGVHFYIFVSKVIQRSNLVNLSSAMEDYKDVFLVSSSAG